MALSVFQILYGKIRPYQNIITIVVLLVVFVLLAFYSYSWLAKTPKQKEFSDVANTSHVNPIIEIYLFWADWCPHCVKCKPEWDSFKTSYDGKVVNNFKIMCYDVDCSSDKPNEKQLQFNVTSFPTVKAVKPDSNGSKLTIDYEAKVTTNNLDKFVKSITA